MKLTTKAVKISKKQTIHKQNVKASLNYKLRYFYRPLTTATVFTRALQHPPHEHYP